MPSGGARKGTGPKKGQPFQKTVEKRAAQEAWRERAKKDEAEVYEMQMTLIRKGDGAMIREWNERFYGKVTENFDHTTNGESLNPILVRFIDGTSKDS